MQECCHTAGHGESRQPETSGRSKPKLRRHPGRRYRSGEDQYAPEVETSAAVHECLRSNGRTLPHPAWPSALANCLPLQPAHGHECHAGVDLAVPAPVNDPGLVTIRWQLVRCRPGQQDWLANLNCGHSLACGTEQIGQYGICIHKSLPFARIVAGETGVGLHRPAGCDYRHTQSPSESKFDSLESFCGFG